MENKIIQTILADFGSSIGIPELCFDNNNCCCLGFDDVTVNIESLTRSDTLFLYTNLGKIPQNASLSFYEMILEADFLFKGTKGATIGISKELNAVAMSCNIPMAEMSLTKFENRIEDFVNVAEYWSKKIRDDGSEPVQPGELPFGAGVIRV